MYLAIARSIQTMSCANQFTRTATVAATGVRGGVGCAVSGLQNFQFTNPVNGSLVTAQRAVPGVDQAQGGGTTNHPNYAYGADPSKLKVLGFDNLKGGDLVTDTNGLQNEGFDQQAGTSEVSWQANDKVTLKYIFGYSSFFYDRNTDVDLTSSDVFDNQFYVSQEAEYTSHELQAFTDVSDYALDHDGTVLLRLEDHAARRLLRQPLYAESAVRFALCQPRIWNRCHSDSVRRYAGTGVHGRTAADATVQREVFWSALQRRRTCDPGLTFNCFPPGIPRQSGLGLGVRSTLCYGGWKGNTNSHVAHQNPFVSATDLQYQTRSERNSFAAYTQGVYTFNEHFALTLGARWARDQLTGEENIDLLRRDRSFHWDLTQLRVSRVTRAVPAVAGCGAGGTITTASASRQSTRASDTWRLTARF